MLKLALSQALVPATTVREYSSHNLRDAQKEVEKRVKKLHFRHDTAWGAYFASVHSTHQIQR